HDDNQAFHHFHHDQHHYHHDQHHYHHDQHHYHHLHHHLDDDVDHVLDDEHDDARLRNVRVADRDSGWWRHLQRHDPREQRADGVVRVDGQRPRARLSVDPGRVRNRHHPDLWRRHQLRHCALHPQQPVRHGERASG